MTIANARTWLYVPGDRPERFGKALASGAHAVIVDLEDAVARDKKEEARANVLQLLTADRETHLAVRVNPLASLFGLEDMAALLRQSHWPDALILPKVESPSIIRLADDQLRTANTSCVLIALIESARGVEAAGRIAASTDRLATLMFGGADYAADFGRRAHSLDLAHARGAVANAAAAFGRVAIDTPWFALTDVGGLEEDCRRGHGLGFFGKAAIHPAQLDAIEATFAPTVAEVADARLLLARSDGSAAAMEGQMVDEAVLRWARRRIGEPVR